MKTLLFFFLINPFLGVSQFNEDSKEIKRLKIKSISVYDDKQLNFDREGRLVEYIEGDVGVKLEESNIPYGEITSFKIDTVGNITRCFFLEYSGCEDSVCIPDTMISEVHQFEGSRLVFSKSLEKYSHYELRNSERNYVEIFSSSSYGDTTIERLYNSYNSLRKDEIDIQFIVKLAPREKLFFKTKIPTKFMYSDSACYFLDSLDWGRRTFVSYNRKGEIVKIRNEKRGKILNTLYKVRTRNGVTTWKYKGEFTTQKSTFNPDFSSLTVYYKWYASFKDSVKLRPSDWIQGNEKVQIDYY